MSEQDIPDIHLKVLYDFEYVTKDGRKVIIKEGEKLFLIKRTNSDWWQVIRSSAERPFYVPATYVEEYSWSPISSKEIKRSSVRRHQEKKLNVPKTCELKNIPKRLPSDKEESSLHNDQIRSSCSSTGSDTSNRNSYKQNVVESSSKKEGFNEDHTKILHDKRKSWAVEELVTELSKMRTERNESSHHESANNNLDLNDSVITSRQNIMQSSINMASDDKITHLSDYPLSIEKDNTDDIFQRNQLPKKGSHEENINSRVGVYSLVCPSGSHGSRSVGNVTCRLSDSLEKLAQQIQFEPVATSSSRSTPTKLSRSLEEHTVAVEDSTKMDSMFNRMKNKLGYSSSFKTKKELQQVKKRSVGNSVLSTSWEMSLSEPQCNDDNKDKNLSIQSERVLRSSGSALESVKGEAKILDGQLKPCRSGSELDILEQRGETKRSPNQSWNLLRHKVHSGKLKKIMCVSESESEEYLDESVGHDEGSVSGLSDDNLLLQSSTSKIYSDISDGAISDDLFISTESIRDSDGCKDQSDGQRRRVSLTRGSRVDSHGSRHYSSPPSPLPGHQPVRVLNEGWEEYRTLQGRTFYYNSRTREKSWKPPRRQHKHSETAEDGSIENLRSDSSSPLAEANGTSGTSYVPVPKGWREAYDDETGQPCYVNDTTGAKVCMIVSLTGV